MHISLYMPIHAHLMNACLHLAPHEGTTHDLARATHTKRPHIQVHHAHRPLHAHTCKFYKVVLSRESRGHQTRPTPNPHATHTCPTHAQTPIPRFLLRLLCCGRRYSSPEKTEICARLHCELVAAECCLRCHSCRCRGACRVADAAAAEWTAALGAPACAMKL